MSDLSSKLTGCLRHIVGTSTPQERDGAIEAMRRILDNNNIKYGDLRVENPKSLRLPKKEWLQDKAEQAMRRAEEIAQLIEATRLFHEAEAKVQAARAKLRRERKEKTPVAEPFTPDRLTHVISGLNLTDLDDTKLFILGRGHASSSRERSNNSCADHDLPFGQIVDEAILRHKAITDKKPTLKEHLEKVFGVTKQWCYRCRDAWLVVTSEHWPEIVAEYGGEHSKFSVDGIVGWNRQWKAKDVEPTPKTLTAGEKYKKLCVAVSDANTLAEALDDLKRIDSHLATKLAKLVRKEDEDLREQNDELRRENSAADPLPYLDRIRDLEEEVSELRKKLRE